MRRLVFDDVVWGGVDKGDNSCFWKPATIIKIYKDISWRGNGRGLWLADVVFDHGRVSKGHFISGFKKIKEVN